MMGFPPSGRVVLLADGEPGKALRQAFRSPALQDWDAFVADDCEHAHFLVQMDACDVLVVDDSALGAEAGCLDQLTCRPEVPVLFLSENDPELIFQALARGARQWLPRQTALDHPVTLDVALRHVLLGRAGAWRARRAADQLRESRAQVSRLANLLWETTPAEGRQPWFSQRYMLQRLHEEVCRSQRHGGPLALVLGEVRAEPNGPEQTVGVSRWVAERVHQSKRRCDVAGQYGPNGFLLLLPHTSLEAAGHYCRRLRRLLEAAPVALLSYFGLAGALPPDASPKLLLRQAEEQLQEARAAGASQPLSPS
jgi:GGDEF domain-containing protein